MTPDERIAQLEAALALERAKVHELSAALAVSVSADAHAKRVAADRKAQRAVQNRTAYERRKQGQHEIQRAECGADSPSPPSPLPSSFPPSSKPSSPYPLSFPPSSPPPSASQEPAPVPEGKPFALAAEPEAIAPVTAPEELQALWNRLAAPRGLPSWKAMGKERAIKARARLRAEPRLPAWEAFLIAKLADPFYLGSNGGWRADPEWLLRAERAGQVTDFFDSPETRKPGANAAPKASDPGWVTV